MKISILLFLLFFTVANNIYSQALPCGPSQIDKAALLKALKFESSNKNAPAAAAYVLRVYFHDVAYDDGSNLTASVAQLNAEFIQLTKDYAGDNICFVNAGIDQINSTQLDTAVVGDPTSEPLFSAYNIPNCINIYYLKKIKGTNNACNGSCGYGGFTFHIPDTATMISQGNIASGQTISHEVGHCLGLYHTFENWNGTSYEDIDGSNSSSSADYITDTKADPYAYHGKNCYKTSNDSCTYTGSCTDPKGASNFSPPYTNLMAYWWAYKCYFGLALTSGQYTRVNSFLNTNAPLIACESPSTITEGPLSMSSGFLMTSAINTLTTNGSVNLSGSANVTFGGGLVSIEPGFHAFPSTFGYIAIEPVVCNGNFAATLITQTNVRKNELSTSYNSNIHSLITYPNPTTSEIHFAFTLETNENNVLLQIYDMNSKMVKTVKFSSLLSGKQNISINLNDLPSGIYYAIIQLRRTKLSTKIILMR